MMHRTRVRSAAVALLLLGATACASHVPPNLNPQATVAWHATRVIKAIDAVRDIAQAGTKTAPPVFSVANATKVTAWHRSALLIIHDTPNGWPKIVDTSLGELVKQLPAAEKAQLGPYIELARTVLKEVAR